MMKTALDWWHECCLTKETLQASGVKSSTIFDVLYFSCKLWPRCIYKYFERYLVGRDYYSKSRLVISGLEKKLLEWNGNKKITYVHGSRKK